MKKCDNCGFDNNETSNFCENCGTKLKEIVIDNTIKDKEKIGTNESDVTEKSNGSINTPIQNETVQNIVTESNAEENKSVNINSSDNEEKNTIALVGFIVSLVSTLLCCGSFSIISLVLSIIGLTESKKANGKNKGLSVAGIIISSVGIMLLIILSILGTISETISSIKN